MKVAGENYYELCMQMVDNGYQANALQVTLYEQMAAGTERIVLTTPNGVEPRFNDWLSYKLEFARLGSHYVWETAKVSLQRNFPIQHALIDGLDTAQLERRMKPIDWLKDYSDTDVIAGLIAKHQQPTLGAVKEIMLDLYKLINSKHERALQIAVQLHQRYILPGPLGVQQGLHKALLEMAPLLTLDIDMQKNPFSLKMAYNLLSSRAVRKRVVNDQLQIRHNWYRLPLDTRGFGDPSQMIVVPDFDLAPVLGKLGAKEFAGYGRHSSMKVLQAGDPLVLNPPAGPIAITVDPQAKSVYGIREDLSVIDFAGLINHLNKKPRISADPSQQSTGTAKRDSISKWKFRNPFSRGRRPGG